MNPKAGLVAKVAGLAAVNSQAIIVNIATRLAEKEYTREYLRDYCRENNLKFNLRNRKSELAEKMCQHLLLHYPGTIWEIAFQARSRWLVKVNDGGRQPQEYYKKMLDLSGKLIQVLEEGEFPTWPRLKS